MCDEIEQLILDVEICTWNAPMVRSSHEHLCNPSQRKCFPTATNTLEEQLVFRAPKRLSELFGFGGYTFPKPEELSKNQLWRLTHAMEKMWVAWRIIPEFPTGMPVWQRYMLMRDYLGKEMVILQGGEVHISFEGAPLV